MPRGPLYSPVLRAYRGVFWGVKLCFTSQDLTYPLGFHIVSGGPSRLTNIREETFDMRRQHLRGDRMIFLKLKPLSHSTLLTEIRWTILVSGAQFSETWLEFSL